MSEPTAPRRGRRERDPAAAWKRYKDPHLPLHDLTETVARAVHETNHPGKRWDADKVSDQWLAVGSWIIAEAVVAALPLRSEVVA